MYVTSNIDLSKRYFREDLARTLYIRKVFFSLTRHLTFFAGHFIGSTAALNPTFHNNHLTCPVSLASFAYTVTQKGKFIYQSVLSTRGGGGGAAPVVRV